MTHNAPSTLTNVSTREGDDVNSLKGGKRARRASFLQRTTTSPLSRVRVTRVFTKCSSLRSSCSLSLLARNHFPMDSRRRRTKKKKSELIKKSTYPRHPINQTTFVGGKEGRKIDEEKVERTTITVGYLLLTQLRKNAFVFGEPNSARCLKPVQSASWRETKSFLEWVGE